MRKTPYYSEEPLLQRDWKPFHFPLRKYSERIWHQREPIKDHPSPLDELSKAVKESFLWDEELSIEGRAAAQLVIPEGVERVSLSIREAWAWLKVVVKGRVEIVVKAEGDFYTTMEVFALAPTKLTLDVNASSISEWRGIAEVHASYEERLRALAVEGSARLFTQLNHTAHSKGRSVAKAISLEKGRVSMEGLIRVPPYAEGVDSYLEEHALLLKGRAYQYPSLEIENNDVKASHSASLFPIEEEDLFYLQQRGIERREAYAMLVEGFLGKFSFREELRKALANLEE